MSDNLYALIAAQFPADPAAVFLDVESGAPVLYRDIDGRAARIATALAAHGAMAGDRVVAQVDKSPDAVMLYLACLRAGLVFVPRQHCLYRAGSRLFSFRTPNRPSSCAGNWIAGRPKRWRARPVSARS